MSSILPQCLSRVRGKIGHRGWDSDLNMKFLLTRGGWMMGGWRSQCFCRISGTDIGMYVYTPCCSNCELGTEPGGLWEVKTNKDKNGSGRERDKPKKKKNQKAVSRIERNFHQLDVLQQFYKSVQKHRHLQKGCHWKRTRLPQDLTGAV